MFVLEMESMNWYVRVNVILVVTLGASYKMSQDNSLLPSICNTVHLRIINFCLSWKIEVSNNDRKGWQYASK